jgi:hypothetical protein
MWDSVAKAPMGDQDSYKRIYSIINNLMQTVVRKKGTDNA